MDEFDRLVMLLTASDAEVREEASEALGKLGDFRAIQPAMDALKDENPDIRSNALWLLSDLCENISQSIFETLDDKEADNRGVLASRIGDVGRRLVIEPLLRLQCDDDVHVREEAEEWLEDYRTRINNTLWEAKYKKFMRYDYESQMSPERFLNMDKSYIFRRMSILYEEVNFHFIAELDTLLGGDYGISALEDYLIKECFLVHPISQAMIIYACMNGNEMVPFNRDRMRKRFENHIESMGDKMPGPFLRMVLEDIC
jgi:hypothetical protein